MMKTLFAASVAAVALSGAVIAQDDQSGENIAVERNEGATTGVEQLALAQQLYQVAAENRDPLAMIVAARLRAGVSVEDRDYEAGSDDGDVEDGEIDFLTADDMFEEARILSRGDETLNGLIADAEAEQGRGRVSGPGRDTGFVRARSTTFYNLSFRGGERAAVYANGPGITDLDMYVYDQNGNTICRDIDYSDNMSCFWTPRWTGAFRVEVRNLGNTGVSFNVVTN
ncbi:MAG: hypothetical protein RIA71_14170 [Oceanicaulis sp.]